MSSWEMMFLLKIVPTSTFRNQSELPSTMNVAVAKTVHAGQHVIVKAGIERIKTPFTVCKYLHWFREISKFEKYVKYANEMTDDVIYSTQNNI